MQRQIPRRLRAIADTPLFLRMRAHMAGLGYSVLPRLPGRVSDRLLVMRQKGRSPSLHDMGDVPFATDRIGSCPVVWLGRRDARSGLIVYLHGGGFIGGPNGRQWRWLATLQRRTGASIAVPLYPMPPRHPFPAAWDATRDLVTLLRTDGLLRKDRWILAGDSAGAGLALALAEQGAVPQPAGLALVAPWSRLSVPKERPSNDPTLSHGWLKWAARLYANRRQLSDPRLSPLFGNIDALPPVHLTIGTRDLFLEDARTLRDRLKAAERPLRYIEQPGGLHIYPMLLETRAARAATVDLAGWITERIAMRPAATDFRRDG